MTKHLLTGVAAFGLMWSAAFAQTYIPVSPPPAAVAPPEVGSTTATTRVSPRPNDHTTTITKGADARSVP
jgi:hypothetical protein